MQTAQMNSPARFTYQTVAPLAVATAHTLDDFRTVRGSYAGSFSGKSRHPIWIAVGMIAVVGSIALGVNMYSESNSVNIETAASAPGQRVLAEPTASALATPSVEARIAREIAATPVTSSAPVITATPTNNEVTKPAPSVTRKTAPSSAARGQTVITPPEVVPPSPAIVEPVPTPPPPIIIDPPAVPAPMPVPMVPSVEPPKL